MRPDVVADVGNSRIKWGLCGPDRIVESISLPPDDPAAWQKRRSLWGLEGPRKWVLAGVQPETRGRLAEWLRQQGDAVTVLDSSKQLRLRVRLEQPERVGMDRLLNAVAAKRLVQRDVPILIVDAGSAVTVDWVDASGAFCGGLIFPGCRLMAKALHDYTALLPLVELDWPNPPLPGTSTVEAIRGGVYWAVAGGIKACLRQLAARCRWDADHHLRTRFRPPEPISFLTGGDAALVAPVMDTGVIVWPDMTLEGIRVAAEALP